MCQPTTSLDDKVATAALKPVSFEKNADDCNAERASSTSKLSQARQTLERGTLLTCLSLLLLITGMSITFPQMQSRRDELGCDSLCYGTMTSVRSALGLVGTAVMGRLSDKNGSMLALTLGSVGKGMTSIVDGATINTISPSGRRACLFLGTIATLLGLAIAVSMDSLHGLWLSMIPGALLQHNFDVFKALLSEYHNDIEHEPKNNGSDAKDGSNEAPVSSRSGSVGKLGMAAGISFMIGPLIAAVASPTFRFAVYFAIVCTLASGLVIFYLPMPVALAQLKESENNIHEKDHPQAQKSEFTLMNLLKLRTSKSRAAVILLVIRLNMALAFHIFNTIWPASLKARFNFGPSDHAKFMSFFGVTYAFSQGFLAKRLVALWGKDGKVYIIMACCAVLGAGRYVAYYTESLVVIYATFLFIINALGTLNTVLTADTGSIAPSNEVGGLFGILQAAESAAGMIGPFLGGVISHYLGKDAPLIAVVGVYGSLFAFVSWGYERYVTSTNNDDGVYEEGISGGKEVKKSI